MATVFDKTSELLGSPTSWTRLQSRGTIRLILSAAKVDANTVSRERMIELISHSLAEELKKRGINEPGAIVQKLIAQLRTAKVSDSAYDIFAKI
jgi:hypothetical protein